MSKLYYDHLIVLTDLESEINDVELSFEEREELWHIVDEIIHQRILEMLLDELDEKHHEEFLEKHHETPYDEVVIVYLNEKIDDDVEELIKKEADNLQEEILQEIKRS